jgi:hypothetical protein
MLVVQGSSVQPGLSTIPASVTTSPHTGQPGGESTQ